jgi:hypothetical protein
MALTKTASAAVGGASPKTSPNSITTVSYYNNPQAVSGWTTSAPQVLYTAPSDCTYARIVIPYKMRSAQSNASTDTFKIESGNSTNYWIGLSIVNDTNSTTDNIIRGYHAQTGYDLNFNFFQNNGQYDDNSVSISNPFDVVANYQHGSYRNTFIIHQDRWILNPGEKFVATTGHNSMSQSIFANFQAWVYN